MLWTSFQLSVIFLFGVFNLLISFKIFVKPTIHNVFNISLACLFGFLGIAGPLLAYSYFEIFGNLADLNVPVRSQEQKLVCAKFIEGRNMIFVAQQIIGTNIMFRFFLIVHAEKGFVSSGVFHSKIFNFSFIILFFFSFAHSYLPWMITAALAEDYPQSTVKGRICLHLRLEWDKDKTKETSDIYIKPRLMVLAFTIASSLFLFYMFVFKTKQFMRGFCISQRTFGSIGGRFRRNILTFAELSIYQAFVVFFILFDSFLIISFYHTQDLLGQNKVFLVHIAVSAVSDFLLIVLLPAKVLYQSFNSYPEMWTTFVPKNLTFYSSKFDIEPRRTQLDHNDINESKTKTNTIFVRPKEGTSVEYVNINEIEKDCEQLENDKERAADLSDTEEETEDMEPQNRTHQVQVHHNFNSDVFPQSVDI